MRSLFVQEKAVEVLAVRAEAFAMVGGGDDRRARRRSARFEGCARRPTWASVNATSPLYGSPAKRRPYSAGGSYGACGS